MILDKPAKDSGVSSYEDIVSMISVLEQEEVKSYNMKYSLKSFENGADSQTSSTGKSILNFLDDVEKDTIPLVNTKRSPIHIDDGKVERKDLVLNSRMGSLLSTDMPELAKQVMTLSLQLEESRGMCNALEEKQTQILALIDKQRAESKGNDARHQTFINQLLKEKQQLVVQYETALQVLKGKHETAMRVLEESLKIELKKNQDKFNASEKNRRDKWIDAKTKKIKELTVRGLEPELERMVAAHQEEIAEFRQVHQRQLEEAEAVWARSSAAMRKQEAAERQAAVECERDTVMHRVEQEINEIEKSYQEQRRRLLEELKQEKEMAQRQSERIITEKQAEFDKKVIDMQQNLQNKMAAYEKQHQTLEKLRKEYDESMQQYEKKLLDIQLQLNCSKQSFQVQVNKIHNDKEKELQQVYSRVKEAINKKEEALQIVSRQRDAVLEQCSQLDKLLQNQRAQLL